MLFIGTTAILGASGTWESDTTSYPGYPVQVNLQQNPVGSIKTDQSGTLYIEQSPDGTNWDLSTSVSITGGTAQSINASLYLPWVRLRYVNGGTPQTYFRVYATLNNSGPEEPV